MRRSASPRLRASGAKGIALVLCAFGLGGCASLDVPERPDRIRLSETGLRAFEGVYAYRGLEESCAPADSTASTPEAILGCWTGFERVLTGDDRALFALPTERGIRLSDAGATVRLEPIGPDRLRATLSGLDGQTWTEELSVSVQPDGYARLHTRSGLVGFPPLVWAIRSAQAQIGLDASGDLVYDEASGGMAFFTLIPIYFDGAPLGPVTFRRLDR